MKQPFLLIASSLALSTSFACGPSYEPDRVMTPEERLQEQERLAYEAEQNSGDDGSEVDLGEDDDEVKPFDEKQAELELRRATLSAVTCPETQEKAPKGAADVTVVFSGDGTVKSATLSSPFAGSSVEECVLTAYNAVIIPIFNESERTVQWKVDLSGKKEDLMPKEKDEVAEALAGKDKKKAEPEGDKKDEKKSDKKKK